MAGMLSQFSDIQRVAAYRCTTLEISCEARAETLNPYKSPLRIQRLFRLPYRLIEVVADFNRRHAAACVEKLNVIPIAGCSDPWSSDGERRLEEQVLAAVQMIKQLTIERWSVSPTHAAIFADIAADELRQWIREEYEAGRDAHLQAIALLSRPKSLPVAGDAPAKPKPRRRSNRKAPVDEILGKLEKKRREELERDFPAPDALDEKMAAELYSLSARDLKAPVNEKLKSDGAEPVSAKTISRSGKYKGWKKYRRRMPLPATAMDCGPAFDQPGRRAFTVSDVADADLMESGLVERSGRRLRSSSKGRSQGDRVADQWANGIGVTLPPTD